MQKNESREDYLEAILQLEKEGHLVRSIDVAKKLSFSRASISVAMKKLREEGYIEMSEDGTINLTAQGLEVARKTLEKHEQFTKWFIAIGVDPEVAEQEACAIEHSITEDTFEKLKAYFNK